VLFCLVDPSSLVAPGPEKIDISSVASEHIINPGELRFSIGLPADCNHRSDPLVRNKLSDFIDIIVASSSCSASFSLMLHVW
jgi:hypothetical protein